MPQTQSELDKAIITLAMGLHPSQRKKKSVLQRLIDHLGGDDVVFRYRVSIQHRNCRSSNYLRVTLKEFTSKPISFPEGMTSLEIEIYTDCVIVEAFVPGRGYIKLH